MMDEQRRQAYLRLIEQLLNCQQGKEAGLLQANAELVDGELLEVMKQIAAYLESQGDRNAKWLWGFATQLAQELGLETANSTRTEDVTQFLLETLQLVAESQGDPQQVYVLWAKHKNRMNQEVLQIFSGVVTQMLAGEIAQQVFVARTLVQFGHLIWRFPKGIQWVNLELAISAYEHALKILTREAFPSEWAMAQNNLAVAYRNRIRGEQKENLERTIACYENALKVFTQDAFPEDWAMTQHNLASAYFYRIQGDRAENLERSIIAAEKALTVRTREAFPEKWASTQNTLSNAYSQRLQGDRAENLECSITASKQALEILTCEAFPEGWAMAQNNLAVTYIERIRGERAENVEAAIEAYQNMLQVRTREAFPEKWANAQNNLAIAYLGRIQGDRRENVEQAISACMQALDVFTYDAFPESWATAQNTLANAYSVRIQGERSDNIEQAISAYELTLRIYTRDGFPQQWARTQKNLAVAYSNRIQGNPIDNLEQSIAASQLALQVYTRDAFPEKWADIQTDLASAYCERFRGKRGDNVEQSIAASQLALQVYTRDAFPEKWARIQHTLAAAYAERILGERSDNIKQAITASQLALQIYTCSAFPREWASIQSNLSSIFSKRLRGNRSANVEQAIEAAELAMQVYTRDAFPERWANTHNHLAAAYANRFEGDSTENLERAITASQSALQVFTRETYPKNWARTQINLAGALFERIQGDRSANLEQTITVCKSALQVYTRDAFPEDWARAQNLLGIAYRNRVQGDPDDNIKQAIAAFKLALQVYTPDAFSNDCRSTSRNLGNLHFKQEAWADAADAYITALSASETLYQACILLDGKAVELAATEGLPHQTAYVLARIGKLREAVEVLEQSRARGLSEALDRDRANLIQLQQTASHLYGQYLDITNQLRSLESQQRARSISGDRHSLIPEGDRNSAMHLHQSLKAVITQIRQVEGYADFLNQPHFEDIRAVLQPHRPLVYLVSTVAGSLALVVEVESIKEIWLDDFTEPMLREILFGSSKDSALGRWFGAYLAFRNDHKASYSEWCEELDHTTQQLWQPLMEPLVRHLKTHNFNQAILIPTGDLSLLPLHAAWTGDSSKSTGRHYALDDIHFTYASNAKSLTAAQVIATRSQANSILAINNPTQDPKLPNSEQEVQSAIAHFPQHQVLRHGEATIASVCEALQHCNILHLSCHGTASFAEPLTNGLLMSDGLLTLKATLDLNLAESATGGIRLAILSACETGVIGIENTDEAISLPTGLLQAGVAGVIASLWAVSDLSTMLLISKFYDLWREQNLSPDQALRQAQIWLRDTTEGEIAALLGYRTRTPTRRPFDHPYYWSAFSYTGI